jgi:hypothetical protein
MRRESRTHMMGIDVFQGLGAVKFAVRVVNDWREVQVYSKEEMAERTQSRIAYELVLCIERTKGFDLYKVPDEENEKQGRYGATVHQVVVFILTHNEVKKIIQNIELGFLKRHMREESLVTTGRFFGCYRDDMPEPYALFMFESEAKKWVTQQDRPYEVRPTKTSFQGE